MEKGSVVLNVTYVVKPGKGQDFVREVKETGLLAAIRNEEGCLKYAYFLPAEEDGTLLLVEKWASEGALAAHMETPNMKALREIKDRHVEETLLERFSL